jgi:hypothetical protein
LVEGTAMNLIGRLLTAVAVIVVIGIIVRTLGLSSSSNATSPTPRRDARTAKPPRRDPRTIKPSERPPRITPRGNYVAELIRREPSLAGTGLTALDDVAIKRDDDPDAYNAVNSSTLTDAVVRVLSSLVARGGDPSLIRTLVTNLTSDRTAVGYAAQFQGYDWLSREGAHFAPEVEHAATLRSVRIALDGRFGAQHGGAFFDIKSYAFEPQLRAVFQRRLERLTGGATITIDGQGNHAPDAIQEHAFGRLKEHAAALSNGQVVHIPQLGWTVRARPSGPGVSTSIAEYDPHTLAHEHRFMPLWFASQFPTDAPYLLMFVIPYGFGGNPFGIDIFGSAVAVFDQIATHVFGPARSDTSAARQYDDKMPANVTVADAVACLSGLALLSEPGSGHPTTARIHLNGSADHPLTVEQARSISPNWVIIPHA